MKTELLAPIIRALPIKVPKLPPIPVFDEHVENFLIKATGFKCASREDFELAKILAAEGTKTKNQMLEAFKPLTQAIDDIKAPVLTIRNDYQTQFENAINIIDNAAKAWKREMDRIAQAEADRKLEEERKRRVEEAERERLRLEEKRRKEIELAAEWGEPEEAKELAAIPVIVPEVIPPRPVVADSGLTYRKGARTKKKLVFVVDEPDHVNRQWCSPDAGMIKAKVANWVKQIPNPTAEQIAAFEKEIGGGHLAEE